MMMEPEVPTLEGAVGLAVVPDVLWIPLGAKVEESEPTQAVEELHEAAEALRARLSRVHPEVRIEARRLDLGRGAGDKSSRSATGNVQLTGVAEVPLEQSSDFWARATLAAGTVVAIKAAARALSKGKPPVVVSWRNPVGAVRNVQAHRAALTERYHAQLRALRGGAVDGCPNDWDLPIEIAQIPVSLVEVRLTLVPSRREPRR